MINMTTKGACITDKERLHTKIKRNKTLPALEFNAAYIKQMMYLPCHQDRHQIH